MTDREQIIRDYIDGYNEYDVDKMVKDFADAVIFENVVDGETTLRMIGLRAFKMQADEARAYFLNRKQVIKTFRHGTEETEVDIDYSAVAAMDIEGGPNAGDELTMQGTSIFTFESGKITRLVDMS